MTNKIKKIDDFFDFDDDSRFDFNIDTREISDEEEKERRDYNNKMTEENLKDHPKTAGIERMTIDEFREIMYMAAELDNEPFTKEESDELDKDCMEMYGEPFFKKDNNSNE